MRKIYFFIATLLLVSCTKYDEVINLLNEIKAQNEALKADVMALQTTADSLSIALKNTNTTVSLMDRKIDSVKLQISVILTEINSLTTELQSANANIADIQVKIAELQKKCQELFALLNTYIFDINLSNGLVAYYPFNGDAVDSTVNINNGVVNSGVGLTTNRFGTPNSAYNFTGGTITVPHKSYLSITETGQFSLSLWVNKSGSQNPVHIIGKRAGGAHEFNWQLAQHVFPAGNPGGGLGFSGGTGFNGVETGVVSDSIVILDKWEHLVGSYNQGKWSLYKNGILVQQKNSNSFQPDSGTPSLEIGNSGGWGAFFGKLDDVRIYNRELSQSDITSLFNLSY
jgi:hypothetical protein